MHICRQYPALRHRLSAIPPIHLRHHLACYSPRGGAVGTASVHVYVLSSRCRSTVKSAGAIRRVDRVFNTIILLSRTNSVL